MASNRLIVCRLTLDSAILNERATVVSNVIYPNRLAFQHGLFVPELREDNGRNFHALDFNSANVGAGRHFSRAVAVLSWCGDISERAKASITSGGE